jgi:hypothetical protein
MADIVSGAAGKYPAIGLYSFPEGPFLIFPPEALGFRTLTRKALEVRMREFPILRNKSAVGILVALAI